MTALQVLQVQPHHAGTQVLASKAQAPAAARPGERDAALTAALNQNEAVSSRSELNLSRMSRDRQKSFDFTQPSLW